MERQKGYIRITTGFHPKMVKIKNRHGIKIQKPIPEIEYNKNISGIDV